MIGRPDAVAQSNREFTYVFIEEGANSALESLAALSPEPKMRRGC